MARGTQPLTEAMLKDTIEWDVTNWSVALDYWEQHTRNDLSSATALEIGSRHGGLALWFALHGARVLCTDLHGPSELAVEKHKRYNVSGLVRYEALDATDIPYKDYFDVAAFKSVLGGIGEYNHKERQVAAIRQLHSCLKPGGELLFAENLVASPLHQYLRTRYIEWGKIWRWVTIEEMLDFLSIFSQVQYVTLGFLGTLGRNERQRTVLGQVDRRLDALVPEKWRYIMVGIARR